MTRAKRELKIEKKPLTDATKRSLHGVRPNKVLTDSREVSTNLPEFDDDLFSAVREKSILLTRSEKRAQHQKYQPIDEPMEKTKRACSGAEKYQKLNRM